MERYALEELIARGGVAEVWRATDRVLARAVAVKILVPDLARDPEFVSRFRAEAIAAARLTHPNVVAVYDTGSQGRGRTARHFIVMELCPGGSIAGHFPVGRVSPGDAASVGVAVCEALAHAHAEGVLHRDIKPSNVLIGSEGTVKVGDFAIAGAAAGRDLATTGRMLGTMAYLAPEHLKGEEVDERSDLYSLGVVLYELLAGRRPTPATDAEQDPVGDDHPPRLRTLRADVPRALDEAVARALARNPESRWQSARAFASALRGMAAVPTPIRRATAAAPPAPAADARWSVPVVLLVLLGVAAVIGLPRLLEEPSGDGGGGGGDRPAGGAAVTIVEVDDFDPGGDGEEHSADAPAAADGDAATSWRTESYDAALSLVKEGDPGVGLLFDLGRARAIARIVVRAGPPGFTLEIRASRARGTGSRDFGEVTAIADAAAVETLTFPPRSARYWLLWITSLPGGGGGSMEISEVQFFAS